MTKDIDDLLGADDTGRPDVKNRRNKARKSLGPLHDLLSKKLPDLRHPTYDVCDLHKLARLRGMSFQGVYKWFRPNHPNRLPVGQVDFLVELSAKQTSGGKNFAPLTRDELWPFVSTT